MRLSACLLLAVAACAPHAPESRPIAAPTGICPAHPLAPGTARRTLEVGGRTRTYELHVPQNAGDRPLPLVLAFHGGMGNGGQLLRTTGLPALADGEGVLVAAPEGTGFLQTWNAGNCCGSAKREEVDDVAFVRALVSQIAASEACVDPKRIFATGHSNGAMLSYRLACEASDLIAAIAPVGGAMGFLDRDATPPRELFACTPRRPVPIQHLHGLADRCYPFEGGRGNGVSDTNYVSVPATLETWGQLDGCGATTEVFLEHDDARCVRRVGCQADVELCTVEGAGHNWLGSDSYPFSSRCGGTTTHALDASESMWRFFRDHPMR